MANRTLIAIQIIMTLFTHDNFLKFILQFNKHSKAEYAFIYTQVSLCISLSWYVQYHVILSF